MSVRDPDHAYLGQTYGDLIVLWNNWFASGFSDQTGSIYNLQGSNYSTVSGRFEPFQAVGSNAVTITQGTALFAPILTTTIHTGAFPNLSTDFLRRSVARSEMNRSSTIFCNTYDFNNNREVEFRSAQNLRERYMFESPPFKLEVPEQTTIQPQLWERTPLVAGTYDAVCCGIFLLIVDLEVTQADAPFRLHFGATGTRNYRTESVYEINVLASGERRTLQNDFGEGFAR
jgi:hypothetical protein